MTQIHLTTGLLFVLSCIPGNVEGVSCKNCNDVDLPGNCRVSIPCGEGEICSTEEYIDVNRQQAFRLACVNEGRCRLFLNAKSLFGKRQISPKCYECCETDDCNANLCQSPGGPVNRPTLSPPHQVIQTACSPGCPPLFVPFKDKCYFISASSINWVPAKKFCRRHGGNLVSVNSKEEHDFLNGLVKQVNGTSWVVSSINQGIHLEKCPLDNEFEVRIFLGILLVFFAAVDKIEGVTCKNCQDVDTPGNCSVSRSCGNEEICSTEEYTDVNGLLSYRLGCANAARCKLFVDAKSLFGKRQASPRCYECCETDDCNAHLCKNSGGHVTKGNQVTTISPQQVIQGNNTSGCPLQYVPFKDKCYFMSPSAVEWSTANRFCHIHGGNLVSVNSKDEHDFLKDLANEVKAPFIWAYWTGGFYSQDTGKFEYTDGSLFNYTQWFHGNPPTNHAHPNHEALLNPDRSSNYVDLPLFQFASTNKLGLVCELNRN